tara:strand:- start:254 stop:949 length:696 start_codon:yes stop_codon:yes gene_type:complete
VIRFRDIYNLALERKGSEEILEGLISGPLDRSSLRVVSDDRCLAEFTKKIFQSGFVWKIVEKKWEGFEEVFWGFDIDKLLLMPEDMLERKAQDKKIIRNFRKVVTILVNAQMIKETCQREDKSFGKFLSDWPKSDLVGLWLYLKNNGSRLGGNTGPFALRALGIDCFLLTKDVEDFLRLNGIIDSGISSKRALYAAQNFFNDLQKDSGRNFSELSRLIAFSFGDNWVGFSR